MMEESKETVITSEDLFDENKFILDEEDKERIRKNVDLLRKNDIPYFKYMRMIPINSITSIKSKDEILKKALSDYIIASVATYELNGYRHIIGGFLDNLNKKFQIEDLLNVEEKKLIVDIVSGKYLMVDLENYTYMFESCAVCFWVLGLLKQPNYSNKCSVKDINKILIKARNLEGLLSKCNCITKSEILDYFDLISRIYFASKDYGNIIADLCESIIEVQKETLDFITSYDIDSLMKDYLKINCEKGNLKFSFTIPSFLRFEKVGEHTKELLALKSLDESTRIIIHDLEEINIYEFEMKCQRLIRLFKENNFDIINTFTLTSPNLKEKIKQIIIKKDNYALNIYFMYVSNHMIRLDSLIDGDVNSDNYHEIINSDNSNIDLDIIFSIEEVK